MTPEFALVHGMVWGGILSAVMGTLILVSLRVSAEAWLGDYPPDIQEAWGPIGERARRWRLVFGIPILAAPLVVGILSLHRLAVEHPPLTFWPACLSVFVMLSIFNLFDLVIIDWLICIRIRPRFIVLPGTDGLAGYRDYAFHARAFLTGVVLSLVVSPLLAAAYLWAA